MLEKGRKQFNCSRFKYSALSFFKYSCQGINIKHMSWNCWEKLKDMNKACNLSILFSGNGSSAKSFYEKIRSLGQSGKIFNILEQKNLLCLVIVKALSNITAWFSKMEQGWHTNSSRLWSQPSPNPDPWTLLTDWLVSQIIASGQNTTQNMTHSMRLWTFSFKHQFAHSHR